VPDTLERSRDLRVKPLKRIARSLGQFFATPPSAAPKGPQQVVNRTRGTVLVKRLEIAGTGGSRSKGLLGRDELPPGEGLWITPCESVHTFFMRFAIDLVYLDRKLCVKKVRSNVGPWRMSACLTARSVLELPVGVVSASHTERGDTVEFAPAVSDTSD
jgi:uncharacterized membrane protein (UPF0127 family)